MKTSPFKNRLYWLTHCRRIVRTNGRYVERPLDRFCPPMSKIEDNPVLIMMEFRRKRGTFLGLDLNEFRPRRVYRRQINYIEGYQGIHK